MPQRRSVDFPPTMKNECLLHRHQRRPGFARPLRQSSSLMRMPPRYTTEPLESWRSTRGWKRPPGQRSKPKDPVFLTVDEILSDIHGTGKGRALDEHVI